MSGLSFLKGHGTGNDFVVLPDPAADIDLTPELVRGLADRHRGIGGDGVIRVATTAALIDAGVIAQAPDGVAPGDWFMDYRNADGSVAEMCGNGVRVFGHVLHDLGLLSGHHAVIGTRAGRRELTVHAVSGSTADVSVDMGAPGVLGQSTAVLGDRSYEGLGVDMGNPHLACVVPGLTSQDLAALTVEQGPQWDRSFFPDGVNLEIVTPLEDGVVHMRVHERGVGETLSCGTGTVAAAVASLREAGKDTGKVEVRIPGGAVTVTVSGAGSELRGPSVLLFRGVVETGDLTFS
ncbi:diaminopimelate epimerase [Corynebacterium terpenotabidum]|uniref:Diaminopimelate epimerase n=1 Tax=Corynebacterium terpenotabidum Y-11 TaxID=1200352 RepID=S4XEF5_9CORY|nr:diaminopimelate epimerase [Corynebacterium terpenotabidum]AGP30931.1 diaminopimelate epimerase [Corynebacterium terpenotabidum Y-11]